MWAALGDPNYVEPFAGSAACWTLARCKVETINSADGFVANFWRAVSLDAAEVAETHGLADERGRPVCAALVAGAARERPA